MKILFILFLIIFLNFITHFGHSRDSFEMSLLNPSKLQAQAYPFILFTFRSHTRRPVFAKVAIQIPAIIIVNINV
jgi:hypothetical protein